MAFEADDNNGIIDSWAAYIRNATMKHFSKYYVSIKKYIIVWYKVNYIYEQNISLNIVYNR